MRRKRKRSSGSSRSFYSAPFSSKDALRPLVHKHFHSHGRPFRTAFRYSKLADYFSAKITSAGTDTATGLPSCVAGLNFQRFCTILQAASSRRGLPLEPVTAHSVTFPSAAIVYLIPTLPCSCRRIETGG